MTATQNLKEHWKTWAVDEKGWYHNLTVVDAIVVVGLQLLELQLPGCWQTDGYFSEQAARGRD